MKKLYVLFLLVIFFTKANAQWVTIPDANFAAFLQQNYPQCMNGNQMDTTCSAIVNAITLNCSNNNISDLTGIQYFNSLIDLKCNNNQLVSIPTLPFSLLYLNCDVNQIVTLPSLPSSLQTLRCGSNPLTTLPTLPPTLKSLICYNNQLTTLPSLPNTLIDLKCTDNIITSLPVLPSTLTTLWCQNNQLVSLPTLPASLTALVCYFNQITSLPTLPASLISINCSYNQLTTLPTLPASLTNLHCYENQLNSLPALPANLIILNCFNNFITSLPVLPASLKSLSLSNNQLTTLPELPDTLETLVIQFNPITCLPQLKNIEQTFSYSNTNIQCLPNYPNVFGSNPLIVPVLSTYPLCDFLNNPNNCNVYWNISGKVFSDTNTNCIYDTSEQNLTNLKLKLFENGNLIQQFYSGNEGLYSFDTDTGTFTYSVDTTNLPIEITCPTGGFHTSVLSSLNSMDYNKDFAMQCKPGFDVGVKSITRTSGQFFPGNTATVKIGAGDMASFYGLTCASGVSGSVIVDFTGPITFISEAPDALVPSVAGSTLTYTIPDFGLVNFNSDFRFIVQTDTTAQSGNSVCFTVNVTPTSGDNDATNNSMQHCFTVVNSFDPNAKEVYPEGSITPSQEWITYTIHFQNTGNAPAQNIYILDTLDNNLIASSFTLLSYSHEPLTQLFGNVIKFNFPNINLPDSTNDEPNSHGFVQYKVRMAQGLPVGTVISNTAYNFFDFNPPVATNTVSNMVGVTSITNNPNKIDLSVFPNPATDELNISINLNSSSEIKIEVYNSLGQVVKTISKAKYEAGKNLIRVSVADLAKGIYNLKFSVIEDVVVKRIVKM